MQGLANLSIDSPTSSDSDGASTPRGNTDTSDADESESGTEDNIQESIVHGKRKASKVALSREKGEPVNGSVDTPQRPLLTGENPIA